MKVHLVVALMKHLPTLVAVHRCILQCGALSTAGVSQYPQEVLRLDVGVFNSVGK